MVAPAPHTPPNRDTRPHPNRGRGFTPESRPDAPARPLFAEQTPTPLAAPASAVALSCSTPLARPTPTRCRAHRTSDQAHQMSIPPTDTTIRTVSIIEQMVTSVGPWSRLAIAERALRRALELAAPKGHTLDPITVAAIEGILDRARAARLTSPTETATPAASPAPLLSIKAAQKPAESALIGAGLALLQTIDATPRARSQRAHDTACSTAAQHCIERTLPLVIPRLIESWTALRNDARRLAPFDPPHTPAQPPLTDQALGPLW